ncbi:MAG: helix-turn-helix transcriptional regulator [Rhodospirillaceae bacterium]|nr:helix-turn-helix transcriptional regulator [Rhodospirillaceae bacterium]
MPIVFNLDVMMARRKVKSKDLAAYVGITEQNMSLLKSGKIKGVRFSTLERICAYLECQPGDILEFRGPVAELEPLGQQPEAAA